jgi:hypothetical protein
MTHITARLRSRARTPGDDSVVPPRCVRLTFSFASGCLPPSHLCENRLPHAFPCLQLLAFMRSETEVARTALHPRWFLSEEADGNYVLALSASGCGHRACAPRYRGGPTSFVKESYAAATFRKSLPSTEHALVTLPRSQPDYAGDSHQPRGLWALRVRVFVSRQPGRRLRDLEYNRQIPNRIASDTHPPGDMHAQRKDMVHYPTVEWDVVPRNDPWWTCRRVTYDR